MRIREILEDEDYLQNSPLCQYLLLVSRVLSAGVFYYRQIRYIHWMHQKMMYTYLKMVC